MQEEEEKLFSGLLWERKEPMMMRDQTNQIQWLTMTNTSDYPQIWLWIDAYLALFRLRKRQFTAHSLINGHGCVLVTHSPSEMAILSELLDNHLLIGIISYKIY